jgi:hypothetical protein
MTRQAAVACLIAVLAAGAAGCSSARSSASSTGGSGTAPAGSPSASGSTSSGGDPLAALSADAIGDKASADTAAASSVHVTGAGSVAGNPLKLSLAITRSGDCDGSYSEGKQGAFQMILIGKTVWTKPNDAFWKVNGGSDPAVLSIVSGKWIKDSTGSAGLGSMSALCSLRGLFGNLKSKATGLVKGTTGIVDGQRALQLKDSGDGSVYVSDTATPLMIRISASGSGGATFDLTDYGVSPAITAPPASQTLSGKKYGF